MATFAFADRTTGISACVSFLIGCAGHKAEMGHTGRFSIWRHTADHQCTLFHNCRTCSSQNGCHSIETHVASGTCASRCWFSLDVSRRGIRCEGTDCRGLRPGCLHWSLGRNFVTPSLGASVEVPFATRNVRMVEYSVSESLDMSAVAGTRHSAESNERNMMGRTIEVL